MGRTCHNSHTYDECQAHSAKFFFCQFHHILQVKNPWPYITNALNCANVSFLRSHEPLSGSEAAIWGKHKIKHGTFSLYCFSDSDAILSRKNALLCNAYHLQFALAYRVWISLRQHFEYSANLQPCFVFNKPTGFWKNDKFKYLPLCDMDETFLFPY